MNSWKTFFEYVFYRIAKLNLKLTAPDLAIVSVSAAQWIILLNILLFIKFSLSDVRQSLTLFEVIFSLSMCFGIDYFNVKIYKGRYEELDLRWKDESRKKKIIGILAVIGFVILCFGLFFINALIFDRLKKY